MGISFSLSGRRMATAREPTTGRSSAGRAPVEARSSAVEVRSRPQTNGITSSKLLITPNYNAGGKNAAGNNHNVGAFYSATGVLYYLSPTDRAAVFNQDGSNMAVNAAFNVLIFPS